MASESWSWIETVFFSGSEVCGYFGVKGLSEGKFTRVDCGQSFASASSALFIVCYKGVGLPIYFLQSRVKFLLYL